MTTPRRPATPIAAPGPTALPAVSDQLDRLVSLGVHDLMGVTADELRAYDAADAPPGALVAVSETAVRASYLAPLLRRGGREGFVVDDMTDVDEFVPRPELSIPPGPLYLLHGLDRGDDYRSWTPDLALPHLAEAGRTPLTLAEGLSWLLQQPELLQPGACFMTIGSRKPSARGLDSRTPGIWISGGTGRDGSARRGAPKVGWCWAGNHHTWLGVASAAARRPL